MRKVKDSFDVSLWCGDSLEVLGSLASESVDSVVTDPPSGISFMGRGWDGDKGGYEKWVEWLSGIMRECLRVLKPGGHGLVWALPRTSHWTGRALELSGFEIRDVVHHAFGSGFPKSHDVSKGIDRILGAKREVVGVSSSGVLPTPESIHKHEGFASSREKVFELTKGGSLDAQEWEGWGSALKPAMEHWFLVRKPLSQSIAANVLEWRTGGINVQACRISHDEECKVMQPQSSETLKNPKLQQGGRHGEVLELKPSGRWPARFVMSHSPGCERVGVRKVKAADPERFKKTGGGDFVKRFNSPPVSRIGGEDGLEEIADWRCVEGCPVLELSRQSGESKTQDRVKQGKRSTGITKIGTDLERVVRSFGDKGTASRFFKQFPGESIPLYLEEHPPFQYIPKPSSSEKNRGSTSQPQTTDDGRKKTIDNAYLRGETKRRNMHPTVKPVRLMAYFIRLITPPGGIVLDPFMGSGTTGVGAILEGMRFYGIDITPEYSELAKGRVERALADRRGGGLSTSRKGSSSKKRGFMGHAKKSGWNKKGKRRKKK